MKPIILSLRSLAFSVVVPATTLVACGRGIPNEDLAFTTASTAIDTIRDGALYVVRNACSGKALDVASASAADGANIYIRSYVGGQDQQWCARKVDDGYLELSAAHSGKVVDVAGQSPADGANVHQWSSWHGPNQQWRLLDESDGYVKLEPRHAVGKFLDVAAAGTADGTNVQIWGNTDSCAQRWKFDEVSASGDSAASAFDVATFLAGFAPGATHEDFPHGVPTYYDWQSRSTEPLLAPPSDDADNMNWWGEVYANLSDVRPTNTRVAVKNGKLLVLYQGASQWEILQKGDDLRGGGWTEDFTRAEQAIDMSVEPDGSRSMVPHPGHNAHFWPNLPFSPIPKPVRAVLSVAHTHLALADGQGVDDRGDSQYIIALGADWRKIDGSCPNNICTGVAHGKYIKPTRDWRVVVMSSMTKDDVRTLPMPPTEVFLMPDGKYPTN